MKSDGSNISEEQLAALLAEYDDSLVTGQPSSSLRMDSLPPELRPRLERDLDCMQVLRQVWPEAGSRAKGLTHATDLSAGACLGRFQIRRELGRGGYGVVFLAEDPKLGREVALKIPRLDALITPDLRARFRLEARAAASLDHVNVVQVYEAGEVGPISYIASAYCHGVTLASWLRQTPGHVPSPEAAALVATLCDAVQHAHSRGVLHRDLKPANVLLQWPDDGLASADSSPTPDTLHNAVPRITDFGLAKMTTPGSAELTPSGAFLGTPSYMAPEQADGKTTGITTAADVYALGAILYELLTGRPPFVGESPLEILRQVVDSQPKGPRVHNASVDRDLDVICLKCLEKEPGRRYASAEALASDLRRWLRREPVLARPVGSGERLLRWCRHKPALAGLTAALIVALAGGLAAAGSQWLRANRHAAETATQRDLAEARGRKARSAVDEYFTRVSENKLLGKPGLQDLRKELLDGALRFYQDFLQEQADDPAMQLEAAATYLRVGVIHDRTDSRESARIAFQEALTLYENLARSHPDDVQASSGLAQACNLLGDLHARMETLDQAGNYLERARAILEKLAAQQPWSPQFQSELALTHHHLASILVKKDQRPKALEAFEQACILGRALTAAFPLQAEYHVALAATCSARGELHSKAGEWPEALDWFRQADELLVLLAVSRPNDFELRSQLADNQGLIAEAYRGSDRQAEALESWRKVRDIREKLVHENPAVTDFQWQLVLAYAYLGKQYSDGSKLGEALATWKQAFPFLEKLLRLDPHMPDYRHRLADLHNGHGHVYSKMGRRADAIASFDKAGVILETLAHDYPDVVRFANALAINRHNYANEARRAGRMEVVRPALHRSRDLCLGLIATDPKVLAYPYLLVHVYNQLGLLDKESRAFDDANRSFQLALDVCVKLRASQPQSAEYERLLTTCYCNFAELAQEKGDLKHAESFYRQALEIRQRLASTHPNITGVFLQLASTSCELAGICRESNRSKEATSLYEQTLAACARALQSNPDDMPGRSIEAEALDGLGLLLASAGQREKAVQYHRKAVDIHKSLVVREPEQTTYRKLLSVHGRHLGELYLAMGQADRAAALERELGESKPAKP